MARSVSLPAWRESATFYSTWFTNIPSVMDLVMVGSNIVFRFSPSTQEQFLTFCVSQTQSRLMSSVCQAPCCGPLEPVSSAWKLVPWTLNECAPLGGSPTLVSWIYFCWVRWKLSLGLGWLLGHWSHLNAGCGPWNQDKLSLIHLMWKIWIFFLRGSKTLPKRQQWGR